jgi:hypothetical protein
MNSACASHNAENRSLKSRFVAIVAADCPLLADHLPSARKDPLGPDLLPKIEIELAVILGAVAQDPRHHYGSFSQKTYAA